MAIEIRLREIERIRDRQRLLAVPAHAPFLEPGAWDAIGRVAMEANDLQGVGHRGLSEG